MRANPEINSPEELAELIEELGFLPLYDGSVVGYSVQGATPHAPWWSGAPGDPWMWRAALASGGAFAYGKLLESRAAFVSRAWYPDFANFRRDGYDIDARCDEGLLPRRYLDLHAALADGPLPAAELRRRCGGMRGFEGALTRLQMLGYVVVAEMRRGRNRQGRPCGMAASLYAHSEAVFGAAHVRSAYGRAPVESRERILDHLARRLPHCPRAQLERLISPDTRGAKPQNPHRSR